MSLSASGFPESFHAFLTSNGVDAERLWKSVDSPIATPRYIRINPLNPAAEEEIRKEFGTLFLRDVSDCIPGFFQLSGEASLANSELYKLGKIYGVDLSSGMTVSALEIQPQDSVLDLCCAPGMKLGMLAEVCKSVVGVDVNEKRMQVCRKLARKYGWSSRATLICTDGRNFDPKAFLEKFEIPVQFDKVLVDAECTHDGSLKHLKKYRTQWSWETLEKRVLDPIRISELRDIQRGLIEQAFRLLKPGGHLVYSTCSMCKAQNEDIVQWFLTKYDGLAEIVPLDMIRWGACEGSLFGTVRFEPVAMPDGQLLNTSGQFIAKIKKSIIRESDPLHEGQ